MEKEVITCKKITMDVSFNEVNIRECEQDITLEGKEIIYPVGIITKKHRTVYHIKYNDAKNEIYFYKLYDTSIMLRCITRQMGISWIIEQYTKKKNKEIGVMYEGTEFPIALLKFYALIGGLKDETIACKENH